jgi:hypothetical protein
MRAREEPIATLGDFPILRPQQAVRSSVDDPGDPPRPVRDRPVQEGLPESSAAVSSAWAESPLLGEQTTATRLAVPLPGSELRLPSRPASEDRESSLVASQEDTSGNAPSPSKLHLSPPRLGRARTNSSEPGNDDLSFTRNHVSTDGHVDNAALREPSLRNHARSFHHHATQVPAPFQRVQRLISRLGEGITG